MRLSQLESESLVRIRGFYSDGRVKSYASNINNETSNTTRLQNSTDRYTLNVKKPSRSLSL